MTDLLILLPNIYTTHPHLRSLLDRHTTSFDTAQISTVDLVTLDPRTICQRARISLNDVNKIVDAVHDALNFDTIGSSSTAIGTTGSSGRSTPVPSTQGGGNNGVHSFRGRNMEALRRRQKMVGFGDRVIDKVLRGGLVTGSLVEIVGESGVGKTQLLLRLCFSIQQPPHNKSAVYICTESQISTKRMAGMLEYLVSQQVPGYKDLSMARIQTAMCQYLDTLEHIVKYQLPHAIEKFGVGLVVVDSIAANFRVEDSENSGFGDGTTTGTPKVNKGGSKAKKLARRAGDIVRLGMCLKEMAVKYNVVVVVANQVSDQFEPAWKRAFKEPRNSDMPPPSSSAISSASILSTPTPTQGGLVPPTQTQTQVASAGSQEIVTMAAMEQYSMPTDELMMTYDYQAKWFTGWGEGLDDDINDEVLLQAVSKLKTPMLGMPWTNILDARVALVKGNMLRQEEGTLIGEDGEAEGRTRRWMKVVFSPWAESGIFKEYEIWEGGVRGLKGPEDEEKEEDDD